MQGLELVFVLLISGIVLLLPLCCGFMVDAAVSERGKRSLTIVALAHAAVWMGLFIGGLWLLRCSAVLIIAGTSLAIVAAMYQPLHVIATRHQQAAHIRQHAPSVEQWLLHEFARIDRDGDGLIVWSDLSAAATENGSEQIRQLAAIAADNMTSLGHVIGETTSMVPMTTMMGNVPVTTFIHTSTPIYGISRDDIGGFGHRMHHHYRNW